MKVQCEYCDNLISTTDEQCPYCGAPNPGYVRSANEIPKTIEELKAWYEAKHLPPENVTCFYIGKNVLFPRAFGIYQDGDEFIVYKNKSNGQRAVRYQGGDEAYAVNELYMKLKEEILNQKEQNLSKKAVTKGGAYKYNSATVPQKKSSPVKKGCLGCLGAIVIGFIVLIILAVVLTILVPGPTSGYYHSGNNTYYNHSGDWYQYDTQTDTYTPTTRPEDITDSNYMDYSVSGDDYVDTSFYDSSTYAENYSNSSDSSDSSSSSSWSNSNDDDDDWSWDSDSDWSSSDSWDSGTTDWDSDW